MKIKEKGEHRLVLQVADRGAGLVAGAVFVLAWIAISQFIPSIFWRLVMSGGGVILLLMVFQMIIGTEIEVNTTEETVVIKKWSLFLTPRQRLIPFASIRNINIEYQPMREAGQRADAWTLNISAGETIQLDHNKKKSEVLEVAREICSYVDRDLRDRSNRPVGLDDSIEI